MDTKFGEWHQQKIKACGILKADKVSNPISQAYIDSNIKCMIFKILSIFFLHFAEAISQDAHGRSSVEQIVYNTEC